MSQQGLKGIFDGLGNLAGLGNALGGGAFGGRGLADQLGQANALQQMQQSATAHQMEMQRQAMEMEIRKMQAAEALRPRHPYENIEREVVEQAAIYGSGTEKLTIRKTFANFREELQAEVDAWLAPVAI